MFYHVYGDLSKSNELSLPVLSMNEHYLELHTYLKLKPVQILCLIQIVMFFILENGFMVLMPK